MILLNNTPFCPARFPDGTLRMRISPLDAYLTFPLEDSGEIQMEKVEIRPTIEWRYESDEEMMIILCLAKYFSKQEPILRLPYIPNARMDRVKNSQECFTLKYFADFINSLYFSSVEILDPHSSVSCALFDNVRVIKPTELIGQAISQVDTGNLLLYFPDEGAMKRYSGELSHEYTFGVKNRDWETGEIQGIHLMNPERIAGRDVLVVDDICSKGGTFYHSAKALKEVGANRIFLYVTHCENTIHQGDLLSSDLIDRIFTTRSIYTLAHEKIKILNIEW